MRGFAIKILNDLNITYNHYLSYRFVEKEKFNYYFKIRYPSHYYSRELDRLAVKWKDGTCVWKLDDKTHRIGKPAKIYFDRWG